ncbi:13946_t:CDS:2 [Cetraspora pellucida]|uniref:Corrinoid adenosyltransferase MMAB n=1 Tax=Cetraspora pellucida TaxID=1433469 RepID=A0A9N8W117_9GLOM|nr:13946_t:CDS:2 [Cetraspora pellucida]
MSYKLLRYFCRLNLTVNQALLVSSAPSNFCTSGKAFLLFASQRRMVGCQSPVPKKSAIYTRTGDKGCSLCKIPRTSSLYNGERRPKNDDIFHSLGTVDELNSSIGIANYYCKKAGNGLDEKLIEIQCKLIEIGSNIATPRSSSNESKLSYTSFDDEIVTTLESWVDHYDSQLPPLKNFILPSGGECAVFLHQCRSICRRAERITVPLVEAGIADNAVGKYLNRLSDFFFVAARYAAMFENHTENIYQQRRIDKPSNLMSRDMKKE